MVSCVIWLYREKGKESVGGRERERCKFGILLFVLVSIYISELFLRVCVFWLEKKALNLAKKSKIKIPELNVLRVDTVSIVACNFIKFTIDADNYTEDTGSSRYL